MSSGSGISGKSFLPASIAPRVSVTSRETALVITSEQFNFPLVVTQSVSIYIIPIFIIFSPEELLIVTVMLGSIINFTPVTSIP